MKELLRYIKDLPHTTVTIRNHTYLVHINGNGSIPLFSIGIGSHLQMTLPESLLNTFKIYSTDLYWIASQRLPQSMRLTMSDIIDDIFEVLSQLKLSACLMTGFSCFGLLALEAAKRKDSRIQGVVMLSTPPGWNDAIIAKGQAHFNQYASEERKRNDAERRENFLKIKKPNESLGSVNAYEAGAARYWKDFNLAHEFFQSLWQDIQVDDDIINHFFSDLLPHYNVADKLDQISVPVVLFAGELDFDSTPLLHWDSLPKPANFTVINCGETGHWPQLENPILFTNAFQAWLKENYNDTLRVL